MRLCWQSYALWQLHWPQFEELAVFLNEDGESMIKCPPRGLEHGDRCDPKPSSTEICCAAAQPATRLRRCESKSEPISAKPSAVTSNFAIFGCPNKSEFDTLYAICCQHCSNRLSWSWAVGSTQCAHSAAARAVLHQSKFAQLCSTTFAETIAGKKRSGVAYVACQACHADSQECGVGRRMHLHAFCC